MTKAYVYEGTWEAEDGLGNVVGSLEVRIHYTMAWGSEPITNLPPEHCEPGSSDQAEIEKIEVEDSADFGKTHYWRPATQDEDDTLTMWADDRNDDLIVEARETETADREDAAEMKAEARADQAREDW